MQSQFKVVADGAALGFGNSPQPLPLILAPELSGSNISWTRPLAQVNIS